MKKKDDLFVLTKAKDLARYIITVTEKSPKKFRFTLVVRLQNYILDILESLYLANKEEIGEERKKHQDNANKNLAMLDYFASLAYEQECILFKQYKQISKQQAECLMYLNKWQKSDSSREMKSEEKSDISSEKISEEKSEPSLETIE